LGTNDPSSDQPRRYVEAIKAVQMFAKRCSGTAFGLVAFATSAFRWLPLTRDRKAIQTASEFLHPDQFLLDWAGSTNITSGVRVSAEQIQVQPNKDQIILLITDGEDNQSGLTSESAKRLAAELREGRIRLHVLHVGQPVVPAEMEVLARETGGIARPALDPETLEQVLLDIARLQQVEMKLTRNVVVGDRLPVALTGLVLGAVYVLSLLGLRYTPW
jgi:Ca-activated chloride channel family protein